MSARQGEKAALFVIEQVLSGVHYGDAQQKAIVSLDGPSARAATAYSRLTLENLTYLDWVLSSYIQPKKTRSYLMNILRLGTARCLFGHEDAAAVNGSVELAKSLGKKGQPGFINGVLRAVLRDRETILSEEITGNKALARRYSWPEYAVNQMVGLLGFAGAKELVSYGNPATLVRVNPTLDTVDHVAEELIKEGYSPTASDVPGMLELSSAGGITRTELYLGGHISLMGKASRMATGFVPKDAKCIIDVCAAPGGKSCAMAEDHPDARIIAMDVSPKRVEAMESQVQRLRLGNVSVSCHDGQSPREDLIAKGDLVLVDAPCSGLGTFLNRPEVKFQKPKGDVRELHYLQRRILSSAAEYVKPGGKLIYCTCTFTKDENETTVKGFLEQNTEFHLCELENPLLPESAKQRYHHGQLRLWSHLDDTDCFYMATMERK